MKKTLLIFLTFLNIGFSQTKYYRIDITDGTNSLFTMNQFNNLVLNGYRIGFGQINYEKLTKKEKLITNSYQLLISGLLALPLTHEEGHRSVLTNLDIGSISAPIIDSKGVAKVIGVTDVVLKDLRDTNFPNYIRLHNAGLESDFDYLKKSDALFNFNEEEYNILYSDYFLRKLSVSMYYLSTLIHNKTGIKESDTPELKKDIVGHDIFGMIRHLHRPDMEFKRYTEWDDLTNQEKNYGKRIGLMSLFNYANPNLWRKSSYKLSENIDFNFSLNYCLAPFGDFIEQNAYLNINKKWKINPFIRQYFNKNNTFWASGINLHNFVINEHFLLNSSIEAWQQPKNQSFTAADSDFGMGIKTEISYNILEVKKSNIFFNLGLNYKTKGFIPASPSLDKDFRVNFGLIIATSK
ncbi:MAG: hypothetical protein KA210_04840 [Bacteroidia bacterium]|nr:hypothetical protein [Bacteroidia bacterium]